MNALLITLMLLNPVVADPAPAPRSPTVMAIPDIVLLDNVPGCYGSVSFNHAIHANMTTITGDCRTCHHDLADAPDGFGPLAPRACRDCHAPTSTVTTGDQPGLRGAYHRQCLACHQEWEHANACGFCHTPSASVSSGSAPDTHIPAPHATPQSTYLYDTAHASLPVVTFHHDDHASRFGLSCADCHADSSCGSCHGPNVQRVIVSRHQNCYSCHAESRCVTCHNITERDRFDHGAATGWFLRPGHASLACVECHDNLRTPERPTSVRCESCHAERWGDGPFKHSLTGVSLAGDHALYDCIACHRGGSPAMLASCTACHADHPVAGTRRVGSDPATPTSAPD